MRSHLKFFIGGQWVEPASSSIHEAINPATETVSGKIAMGNAMDVDRAVAAARQAFDRYSQTSTEERQALLERIAAGMAARAKDLHAALTEEMGSPTWAAEQAHVPLALGHFAAAIKQLQSYEFEEKRGIHLVRKVPIGVCALIKPWNWPVAMLAAKTAPALAVGCTVVLKPSEFSPFTAQIFAEVLQEAGVPPGVFNMVFGDGSTVGTALSRHPDVDMVSITGSTRAGIEVAKNAADTVKRVHQELGGKSPNLMLPDADLEKAVASGTTFIMINSGQSCSAPSRMLVPRHLMDAAGEIASKTAQSLVVGRPDGGAFIGPVVNASQWKRIQGYIQSGIDEGARVLVGGVGKPEGLQTGYYVKPTVFTNVRPDMRIAKEEIFGPVLAIIPYDDEEEAVRIANDSPYGLAAYVHSRSLEKARAVGARIRAGQVYLNGDLNLFDSTVPFGGCKCSGNGREGGVEGLESFLEDIAFLGYAPETQAA